LPHIIYIRTVSSLRLLPTILLHFKLAHVFFDQNNKNNTFDFYPRLARKERNVPLHKKKVRAYCSNIYNIMCTKLKY
jgi:hypothetical protein